MPLFPGQATVLALTLAVPLLAATRETLPLEQWRFQLGDGGTAWAAPAFDDVAWEAVTVPHTWNAFDGEDGGDNYQGGKMCPALASPRGFEPR